MATTRLQTRDVLRTAAWAFLIGWGLHGFDHMVLRGMSASPMAVQIGGGIQGVIVIIAIVMALRGHPNAPRMAIFAGILSAVLFTYAHLLPNYWPSIQDSFVTGPRINVTWFSWLTAVSEIGTGLLFAYAGWRAQGERT